MRRHDGETGRALWTRNLVTLFRVLPNPQPRKSAPDSSLFHSQNAVFERQSARMTVGNTCVVQVLPADTACKRRFAFSGVLARSPEHHESTPRSSPIVIYRTVKAGLSSPSVQLAIRPFAHVHPHSNGCEIRVATNGSGGPIRGPKPWVGEIALVGGGSEIAGGEDHIRSWAVGIRRHHTWTKFVEDYDMKNKHYVDQSHFLLPR